MSPSQIQDTEDVTNVLGFICAKKLEPIELDEIQKFGWVSSYVDQSNKPNLNEI